MYFYIIQISCWMHHYSLCCWFLVAISTTVSCIYLCCYSGEGKAIILLCTKSQLQCWNCHNFLKMRVLILKCFGPNTQSFLRLLPWCTLSTSANVIWVSSSRQKAEACTVTLSQGEELSSSIALAKPSTEGPLCPAEIFCLFCYRAFQWCKRQCRRPVHFPSYLLCWLLWLYPPHAWKKQKG